MLTCDLPRTGRRERDIRNAFSRPEGLSYANLDARRGAARADGPDPFAQNVNAQVNPVLGWADLEWLVSRTSLPVILKGVVRADHARHAVEAGAPRPGGGNHPGRQPALSLAT